MKKKQTTKFKYYDIRDDLQTYPDAWCYLVWSARGPGKTYSTLRYMIEEKHPFCFLKRTIKDVDFLCMDGRKKGVDIDVSPFKPLNRDFGWNIRPVKLHEGFAGFYRTDEDGNPAGLPIGYCAALSAAKDIKGFDLSECDFLIFDEFIPNKFERISRGEGEQTLNIYMTLRRDRLERGREDLKLICLANATSVNNPVFSAMEVIDDAVMMDLKSTEFCYLEERGILMHLIPPVPEEVGKPKTGIEKAMEGTRWAEMSFGAHFAYDDFTSVQHKRLKGYRPVFAYSYKKKWVYGYEKDGYWYLCRAAAKVANMYNLDRENEQKKFFYDYIADLRDETIEDRVTFSEFTMYDLVVNYKKIFMI